MDRTSCSPLQWFVVIGLSAVFFTTARSSPGQDKAAEVAEKKEEKKGAKPASKSKVRVKASGRVHPIVLNLLVLNKRDKALETIVGWQKYPESVRYPHMRVKNAFPIKNVVTCPQKDEGPIFAIFDATPSPLGRAEDTMPTGGHIQLVAADGTIIPYFWAANQNVLIGGVLSDIDGDGILDTVNPMSMGTEAPNAGTMVLQIVPVTRKQMPSLSIAYQRSGDDRKWTYRIVKEENALGYRIEFGIEEMKDKRKNFEVKATYRWSKENGKYEGPAGGHKEGFYRIKKPLNILEDTGAYDDELNLFILGDQK